MPSKREVYVTEVDYKPVAVALKRKDGVADAERRYADMKRAVCVTYVPVTLLDAAAELIAELEHQLKESHGSKANS